MLPFGQTQEMESDDAQIQLLRGTCYTPHRPNVYNYLFHYHTFWSSNQGKKECSTRAHEIDNQFLDSSSFLLFLGPLDHLLIRYGQQFLPCTLLTALTVPQGKRLKVYSNLKQKVSKTPLGKRLRLGC